MKFTGESYLEDVIGFFKDINQWLDGFLETDFPCFTFDCAMLYFNSSTTKLLYNIVRAMDRAAEDGKKVVVNWFADEDDDIMVECGEDFKDEMEFLEFNLIMGN
ncbi:MAG: DUF1987 domain-containing protein [Oscillospiraceae bacterium]|nr:DUF1987 domain-containing protein [Oscillospiraceae bacterium]